MLIVTRKFPTTVTTHAQAEELYAQADKLNAILFRWWAYMYYVREDKVRAKQYENREKLQEIRGLLYYMRLVGSHYLTTYALCYAEAVQRYNSAVNKRTKAAA